MEVIAFAVALAVSGLVALTLLFAGPSTYTDIARASGRETATFRVAAPPPARLIPVDLRALVAYHEHWVDYVTGRRADPPVTEGTVFTQREYSHMSDVRTVFIAAQVAMALAALLLVGLAMRAWRRGVLARLIRAGAASALAVIAGVGVLAALAFDAAFLLFHQIFFPQGNFLFAADSNLLAIYPEAYFYGVTVRIGASFVLLALALAGVAHLAQRRRGASA